MNILNQEIEKRQTAIAQNYSNLKEVTVKQYYCLEQCSFPTNKADLIV